MRDVIETNPAQVGKFCHFAFNNSEIVWSFAFHIGTRSGLCYLDVQ